MTDFSVCSKSLVDDERRQIEQGYVDTEGSGKAKAKSNKKEWISEETWETTDKRMEAKNAVNMARTRKREK